MADRFQVSLRTIYRDIRSLEAAGVPIVSEAGVGYSLMEGYRLPPVMFSREEAVSFVAAEKLMEKFTDESLSAHFESAIFKIKSVLKGGEKEWVGNLSPYISVSPIQSPFNKDIPNAMEILMTSLASKYTVELLYKSFGTNEAVSRMIEPMGLFHENNFWYVMAYCQLRKDYRRFRTDRIMGISLTDTIFSMEHARLDEHISSRNNHKLPEKKVKIWVSNEACAYISNSKHYYGHVSEKPVDGGVEMTFMTSEIENGFPRWFMMIGDCAKVIEPEKLKERMRELVQKVSRNL